MDQATEATMADPDPGQTSSTNGKSTVEQVPGPVSRSWQLDDHTVNAFMLGWRLTELRHRIEIANRLTTGSDPSEEPTSDQGSTLGSAVSGSTPASGATTTTQPPQQATQTPPAASGTSATKQVVQQGQQTEQPAPLDQRLKYLGDVLWMASIWRATFQQVVAAHTKEFPNASTKDTLYEPPGGWNNEELIKYLYPTPDDPANRYTVVGIPPATNGDTEPFSIHDVARRALNALIVLHSRSDDALIAAIISTYQTALLKAMNLPQDVQAPFESWRCAGVAKLSARTEQLLEAWDGFLHEQYYATATKSSDDATNLLAFEAGRALAGLTWSVSTKTVVMECKTAAGASAAEQKTLLSKWQEVLDPYDVARAQHFVTAFGGSLDQAYTPASNAPSYDPNLPSNICRAIRDGLDHWLAALVWLQGLNAQGQVAKPALDPKFYHHLRVALITQSDLWLSLLTWRQNLAPFTAESVLSQVVQNVLVGIEHELAEDAGQQTAQAVRKGLATVVRAVPIALWAGIGSGFLLIILAVVWLVFSHPTLTPLDANGLWAVLSIGGIGPMIAAFFGLRSASSAATAVAPTPGQAAPAAAQVPDAGAAASHWLNGLMQVIESSARSGFQAALDQIRLELAAFNHSIGLSYPLIECFVSQGQTIQNAYSFVAQVIWTSDERREEVEDVVRAALGPASLVLVNPANDVGQASKKPSGS